MRDNKMRRKMIEGFLSALKEDIIPWERNWELGEVPQNATTEARYRGTNSLWLNCVAQEKGYGDPRWCTFLQAKEKGWRIKKGERGTQIEFFTYYDKERKKNITYQDAEGLRKALSREDYAKRVTIFTKNSTVFNAEQIEGIPAREKKKISFPAERLLERRDILLKNMGVKFEEGGDQAYYSPGADAIRMPKVEQFHDAYDYMATFLHEAAHATGNPSRLHRDLSSAKGTPGYAREELRAEIASAFTAQELGTALVTEEQMRNHKAYIQDWIQLLEKNPEELFAAVREAQGISDYLIEKGGLRSMELAWEATTEQEKSERREAAETAEIQKEAEAETLQQSAGSLGEYGRQSAGERAGMAQESGRVEIIGLYEWKGKEMVHYRKDGKASLTDGIIDIQDVDFMMVHSIPGIRETDGIDSSLFAEKVRHHHPELVFSARQLEWIDRNTEKNSVIPPEENGIEVLGLYEGHGRQYVYYTFGGKEYLTDGEEKHQGKEKVRERMSDSGMKRANALDREKFVERMGAMRHVGENGRLLDSLDAMERDKAVRMSEGSRDMPGDAGKPKDTVEPKDAEMANVIEEKAEERKGASLHSQIQELAALEEKLNIPEEERLTCWAGDYACYEEKLGISPEEIRNRLEEYSGMRPDNAPEDRKKDQGSRNSNWEAEEDVPLSIGYARASGGMAAMILDRNPEVPVYCYSRAEGRSQRLYEMPEDREGKVFIVNMEAFYDREDFFPSITCELSESDAIGDNTIYSVSEFDRLMESADREFCGKKAAVIKKYGDLHAAYEKCTEEERGYLGYRKVKFSMDVREGGSVVHKWERQDIGDGNGSAIDFLSRFPSYHAEAEALSRQAGEELEAGMMRAGERQRALGSEAGPSKARMPERKVRARGR